MHHALAVDHGGRTELHFAEGHGRGIEPFALGRIVVAGIDQLLVLEIAGIGGGAEECPGAAIGLGHDDRIPFQPGVERDAAAGAVADLERGALRCFDPGHAMRAGAIFPDRAALVFRGLLGVFQPDRERPADIARHRRVAALDLLEIEQAARAVFFIGPNQRRAIEIFDIEPIGGEPLEAPGRFLAEAFVLARGHRRRRGSFPSCRRQRSG